MTKKHYEAIAEIVMTYRKEAIPEKLADYFAQDNPRFNRDMFLAACGIEAREKVKLNELMPEVFPNK